MKDKKLFKTYDFMPQTRLGRVLNSNLSWTSNRRHIIDKGGFVFDLDKDGRIVRMTDDNGHAFETKETKKLFL